MKVIPAIDLMNGQVVRLYKGDPKQKTIYSDNDFTKVIPNKKQSIVIILLRLPRNGKKTVLTCFTL
jgi:phosphoribosylformimino-5-aminoimidazole carboxamide ribonucleotide (ProFAR) isomerase